MTGLHEGTIPYVALPPHTRQIIVAAGLLYIGGAVLVQMTSAHAFDRAGTIDSLGYVLATSVEEFLEMMGAALFIHAVSSSPTRQDATEERWLPATGRLLRTA